MDVFVQIIAYTAFIFTVILMGRLDIGITVWYKKVRKTVRGLPPAWIFPVVWTLLYALLIPAGVLYFQGGSSGKVHSVAAFILYFTGLILNFVWIRVFFQAGRYLLGLILIVVMIGLAIGLLILAGLDQQFVSLGLFLPYTIWLFVALYLNIRIIRAKVLPPMMLGSEIDHSSCSKIYREPMISVRTKATLGKQEFV